MYPNLMDRLGEAEVHTLYQLRDKLDATSMNLWLPVINEAHPWVKVRMLYRLKDKYDAVLTSFFPGCGAHHYFDAVCQDLVDINKLDTTFLSLCYRLEQMAAQAGFDEEKRKRFRTYFVAEFTKRTYNLDPLRQPKRTKPEELLITLMELNPFVEWDKRQCVGAKRGSRVWLPIALMKHKLKKLLYTGPKQVNPSAFLHLQEMAMRHPGKLLSFLS